jgi:hypothetical protein
MSSKWPYMAGIIDGEGSIVIHPQKGGDSYKLDIVVPNTSIELIKWILGNFGGRFTTLYPENSHGFNRKPLHRWRLSGMKNRETFLLGILPYLVIKKKQAQLALDYCRLGYGKTEERKELAATCSLLNRGDLSLTTNTLNTGNTVKIESELHGDMQSALGVIQGVEDVSTLA